MPKAPTKRASNADLEFWHEPYNPIYNLVKARPVLVHQYVRLAAVQERTTWVLTVSDATTTIATSSSSGHIWDLCCSTTMIRMLETIARLSEVRSHFQPIQSSFLGSRRVRLTTNLSAFLSWLRLATYMSIVAVAILISFHLKHQPSAIERRVALPFGLVFWFLALACLISGFSNYIKTVNKYSRRQAMVQTGTGTQIVSASGRYDVWVGADVGVSGLYCCGCCDYRGVRLVP